MDDGITRRELMKAAASAAAGVFLGIRCRQGADWPQGDKGVEYQLALPNGRPVWEQPELWARAAALGTTTAVENEAFRRRPSDPVVNENYNYHLLEMGPSCKLAGLANWFFGAIARTCGFSTDPSKDQGYWASQKGWLDEVFHRTFPENSWEMGWVSLYGARRPSKFRAQNDPSVRIEQKHNEIRTRPARRAKHLDAAACLEVGQLVLPTRGVRFASESLRTLEEGDLFATYIPRRVSSGRFGIDEEYEEVWFCVALRGQDETRLRRGQIPAVPEFQYDDRRLQLRTVPMLNLTRVKERARGMRLTMTMIEINPEGGDILSVRHNDMPLSGGLLCCDPVEHVGLCQAFGRLNG